MTMDKILVIIKRKKYYGFYLYTEKYITKIKSADYAKKG
jgi:hypothetical protein